MTFVRGIAKPRSYFAAVVDLAVDEHTKDLDLLWIEMALDVTVVLKIVGRWLQSPDLRSLEAGGCDGNGTRTWTCDHTLPLQMRQQIVETTDALELQHHLHQRSRGFSISDKPELCKRCENPDICGR